MLFNSVEFLVFFPVVCCAYFALPYRFRWVLLLAASYYFYASWKPAYLLLIIASTLVDYVAGLLLSRSSRKPVRIALLCSSLGCNLGLLFVFKYFNFFNAAFWRLSGYLGLAYQVPDLNVLLPVGISFYTFQTLSYTIEVYRGTHPPQRHLGIFALYVAFFPQLVAGPIERSWRFLPQLLEKYDFDYDRIVQGLRLMLWGFFKKVVIADRLAAIVNHVYATSDEHCGPILAIATVAFAYQIYCDFSGYSDIAIGAARVMGLRLMTNFDRPYHARSIVEFWQRWHISLSTWFRDYVYIPLGGSRVSRWRFPVNILVVFAVSGLWHGANWTFVAWGVLHAVFYLLERALSPVCSRCVRAIGLLKHSVLLSSLQVALTFSLVCIAWVLFRAESVAQAVQIIVGMARGWDVFIFSEDLLGIVEALSIRVWTFLGILALIPLAEAVEAFREGGRPPRLLESRILPLRWVAYLTLLLAVMNLGVTDEMPFIYFQF